MDAFHLPLLKGCATGAGLIIAIGAQNAFVIKQGLMKNHVFATALFCALVDSLLIAVGVGGLGRFLASNNTLMLSAKWGGAIFLFWYGLRAFRSLFNSRSLSVNDGPEKPSLKETVWTLAALSFLNPHVYLDTVVLLGSIGATFPEWERPFFGAGAVIASFIWFFGICYGARLLTPLFQSATSWKVLDFLVGLVMWAIAFSLIWFHTSPCSP